MAESTAFPWLKHLPEDAAIEFFMELHEKIGDAVMDTMPGVRTPAETYVKHLDPLIHAWKATAEVHADPAMYQALTQATEGDLGPVPPPHLHDFADGHVCAVYGCKTSFQDFLVRRIETASNEPQWWERPQVPNQREGGHDHEQW